jgi:uncharacterized protein
MNLCRLSDTPLFIYEERQQGVPSGQCDCDCDCACTPVVEVDRQAPGGSALGDEPLQHAPSLLSIPLRDGYAVFFNPLSPSGPVVLNGAARRLWQVFERPAPVRDVRERFRDWTVDEVSAGISTLLHHALLQSPSQTYGVTPAAPSRLTAWLHVTDRCNLRCEYCYLPHADSDMAPATGRAAVDAVFRSARAHGYRNVKLKYAGGEPLLRLERLLDWHHYAGILARDRGLALEGVVLSNGTLVTEVAVAALRDAGLRLMISLDGLGAAHDAQRPLASGEGSSELVLRGVERALAGGLLPDISVTVSPRSLSSLPALLTWLRERELPFSLNFYRENDCSGTCSALHLQDERIVEGMLEAYAAVEADLPRRSLLGALVDRADLSALHQRPCAVGQSYLAFAPDGTVAKCQMDLGNPVSHCRADDPLAELRESRVGLQNPNVDEKVDCQSCPWRYRCAGGCPLLARRVRGSYRAASPNCTIYRALYPEVIRLEGLRLLKQWAG